MNNYEKITNMTEKELAIFLRGMIACSHCPIYQTCHDFCYLELENKGLFGWIER